MTGKEKCEFLKEIRKTMAKKKDNITVDDIDVTVCVERLAHFHFFQHNFAVVSFNTPAIIAVQPLADDAIAEADDLVRIIVLHV